ncbi:MAG: class I SAM-dependent methyltransferase [Pseudomonadales bacterium]
MDPQDVAKSYDQIAHHWDSNRFPRDNGIAQHERAVAFTDLRGPALDVGCGSSGRLIDLLLEHGFSAEGLDISGKMVELARRRHPELIFHHADICEWQFPRSYDFVSAWDSIWHVPLQAQESVLLKIFHALSPGGVAIFSLGGTQDPSETTNSHMGPPMYHSTIGIPRILELIAEAGSICRHLEYDQHPELHAYIICQQQGGRDR